MVPHKSLYWHVIAPVARHSISMRWGKDLARRAYRRGKLAYQDLLLCAPDLGEDNPMLATFCESMVFVALWMGAEGAISVGGLRLVTSDVLGFAPLRLVGLVRNANRGPHALDFQLDAMRETEAWACEHEGGFESTWRVTFDDARHKDGIFFEYTRCPIAEYCRELGVSQVTPVLCELDHHMVRLIHARLIRERTLAEGGDGCDYWIVGDKTTDPR